MDKELKEKAQAIAYSDNSAESKEKFILELLQQAIINERVKLGKVLKKGFTSEVEEAVLRDLAEES